MLKGEIPITQLVLECEESLINKQDKDGNTALHLTVVSGRADIVQTLLFFYPDMTIVNKEGETVWCTAAKHHHWKGLQVLLRHESSLEGRSAESKRAAECLLWLVDGLLLEEEDGKSAGDGVGGRNEVAMGGICERVWQVVEANPEIAKEMEKFEGHHILKYFVDAYFLHDRLIMKYVGGLLHLLFA